MGAGEQGVKTSHFPYPVLPPPVPLICVPILALYCVAPVFRLIKRIKNPCLVLTLQLHAALSVSLRTAGNFTLKAQFIPMGIVFGGRRNGGEQVRFYSS